MKRFYLNFIMTSFLAVVLTSCGHTNVTKNVTNYLGDDLYKIYDTKPINYQTASKCSSPPSVNIFNKEKRKEPYTIFDRGVNSAYVIPIDLMDDVVDYMKDAFERCNVKTDGKSSKVINIYLEKADLTRGAWAQGGEFQLKIEIPEKSYQAVLGAKDNSYADLLRALGYAIHVTTWKVINDKYVQEYILCK